MHSTLLDTQAIVHVPCTWGREIPVKPGVLDDNARIAYTEGQCHALAWALHRITGWAILAVTYDSEPRWDDEPPNHFVVQVPDGRYLDITGTSPDVEDYYVEEIENFGVITGLVRRGKYRMPRLDVARHMALALLAREGLDVEPRFPGDEAMLATARLGVAEAALLSAFGPQRPATYGAQRRKAAANLDCHKPLAEWERELLEAFGTLPTHRYDQMPETD